MFEKPLFLRYCPFRLHSIMNSWNTELSTKFSDRSHLIITHLPIPISITSCFIVIVDESAVKVSTFSILTPCNKISPWCEIRFWCFFEYLLFKCFSEKYELLCLYSCDYYHLTCAIDSFGFVNDTWIKTLLPSFKTSCWLPIIM